MLKKIYIFLKSFNMLRIVVQFIKHKFGYFRLLIHGKTTIRLLHKIAEDNNLDILPAYGTLLGFVRENKFINHDSDIDLFLYSNYEVFEINKKKFNEQLACNKEVRIKEEVLSYKLKVSVRGIDVDIYLPKKIDNGAAEYISAYKTKNFIITEIITNNNLVFPLNIPKNFDEILIMCYGENYNIKDKYPYQFKVKK